MRLFCPAMSVPLLATRNRDNLLGTENLLLPPDTKVRFISGNERAGHFVRPTPSDFLPRGIDRSAENLELSHIRMAWHSEYEFSQKYEGYSMTDR